MLHHCVILVCDTSLWRTSWNALLRIYKRLVWGSYVMRLPAPASVPASCVGSRETTSSDSGRRLMSGPREGWMCYVSTGCVSRRQSGRCCVALSKLYKGAENPLMQSPDVWRLQTVKEASVTLYMKECSGGEEGGVERHLTHFWWISRNENYPDMSETKAPLWCSVWTSVLQRCGPLLASEE